MLSSTHQEAAENSHEVLSGVAMTAVKAAPPVAASVVTLSGYPLPDLVLIATLVYTVLQIILLYPKLKALWRKRR